MLGRLLVPVAVCWVLVGLVSEASAEIVFFSTGRTLSVRSHRFEEGTVVLELRAGGEVRCDRSMIAGIAPDEVPYPEPLPAGQAPAPGPAPADKYEALIDNLATAEGVDARLVKAVVQVESGFRPGATSPKGAMGLMQLMPETARQYALGDAYDPRANLEAGIRHLKSLLGRFDVALALAAYNAGEGAVRKYGGIPPFPETRNYVRQVLVLTGLGRR